MPLTRLVWALGGRLPRRFGDALAKLAAPVASLFPLPNVALWEASITQANGVAPTRRQRRLLLENWIRNSLWSLSLARWSKESISKVVRIDDEDLARLRASLAGPGLVLALPHMGSWDFAGAWCASIGIKVVSVAERLPNGLFERFRDARAGMGMDIYPVDQADLMHVMAEDVRAGRVICLLSDRDLSSRGVPAIWPPDRGQVKVPAGPALLARRTGADLRVATTRFEGGRLRIMIGERIEAGTAAALMGEVVAQFAAAVHESPENWLMLRRVFK